MKVQKDCGPSHDIFLGPEGALVCATQQAARLDIYMWMAATSLQTLPCQAALWTQNGVACSAACRHILACCSIIVYSHALVSNDHAVPCCIVLCHAVPIALLILGHVLLLACPPETLQAYDNSCAECRWQVGAQGGDQAAPCQNDGAGPTPAAPPHHRHPHIP